MQTGLSWKQNYGEFEFESDFDRFRFETIQVNEFDFEKQVYCR